MISCIVVMLLMHERMHKLFFKGKSFYRYLNIFPSYYSWLFRLKLPLIFYWRTLNKNLWNCKGLVIIKLYYIFFLTIINTKFYWNVTILLHNFVTPCINHIRINAVSNPFAISSTQIKRFVFAIRIKIIDILLKEWP